MTESRHSRHYSIAVIPGDGTGPEVVREGRKVLEAAGKRHDITFEFTDFDFGGDRYLKTGETLPESAIEELKKFKAIYLGAIGHPDVAPGILEVGILLKLRFSLDQYINLRPVKLYPGVDCPLKDKGPEDIDFIVIRENTGGVYTGQGGVTRKGTPHEVATQVMLYDRQMVDRCLEYSFGLAGQRKKEGKPGKLTLVHKTNVLVYVGDLWYRAFMEMAEKYPDIKTDYNHVDAACMWMVKNPEWYDVIVTSNMFGDIITDLGAMIQGGMGIAAGGNINPYGTSMFEPIGGSAPKYTGRNMINPLAAIEAGRMMLKHLGEDEAAKSIENSVAFACTKIESLGAGRMGYSTSEVGDMIAEHIGG
ncbi:MAG: 3-isopropylmalate dehydrogenase [Actinobacteria bacterium]|nr:3-isopropylmalate dehydrogenase [Actinomycetota bacterium]